MSMDIKLAYK